MKKQVPGINLVKSLDTVHQVAQVKYEPNDYYRYLLVNQTQSPPYIFQTQISEKEKGELIKERSKDLFKKTAIFGGSAFVSIFVMSLMRGEELTMEHFLAFLIQGVMMVAIVSVVLIMVNMFLKKAFPDKIILSAQSLQLVNTKGRLDIDIPLDKIGYINIVQSKQTKFLCFAAKNAKEGEIMRNSPIFDITIKRNEVYLIKLLKSLNSKLGERRFDFR